MTKPRCYLPQPLKPGQSIELPPDIAHHLSNVLRLRVAQTLILFNGQGGEYPAHVTLVEKKRMHVLVDAYMDKNRESPLSITLAQGIARGQKMDYTIQKGVELGIRRIVPILNGRSNIRLTEDRERKKHEHWQKIIIAACEQCGRNSLPVLDSPITCRQWVEMDTNPVKMILDPQADQGIAEISMDANALTVLIGSEGGLDADEIARAEACGYIRVSLGRRVLRTETAAVAALVVCQNLWGDL